MKQSPKLIQDPPWAYYCEIGILQRSNIWAPTPTIFIIFSHFVALHGLRDEAIVWEFVWWDVGGGHSFISPFEITRDVFVL